MSIFLFHRSLRLHDNSGLQYALNENKEIFPVFCVDPRQADPQKNQYFSPFALGFMLESLQDLDLQLKKVNSNLIILYGEPHLVLPKIIKNKNIKTIYMNKDYTPFARKRVKQLQNIGVNIVEVNDHLLFPFGSITTGSNTAYRVYTSFLNKTKNKKVESPKKIQKTNHLANTRLAEQKAWNFLKKYSKFAPDYTPGGRQEAISRLKNIIKTQKNYSKCRDYLNYKTTHLSAYIKFGCISIREAWYGFASVGGLAKVGLHRELIWREFYYHYYIAYPNELEWDKRVKQARLQNNSPIIVRACFNQLNQSGYLHNRGRMILANYILKNQKDYWKSGDIMYAKRLVDYDPFVNIGNWRWIEKQPPFRTLKPEVQEKKWDQTCDKKEKGLYVKKWT